MGLKADFQVEEGVLIVRLIGELDHHEATTLRKDWQQLLEENAIDSVILNLTELSFIDSSGVGVILGRYKYLYARQGEMIICSVDPATNRLLEMAGLFKIMQHVENEYEALHYLGVA